MKKKEGIHPRSLSPHFSSLSVLVNVQVAAPQSHPSHSRASRYSSARIEYVPGSGDGGDFLLQSGFLVRKIECHDGEVVKVKPALAQEIYRYLLRL